MKNGIRIRFIERDFWVTKIKADSPYIAEDEINEILNDNPEMMDVTMIFIPCASNNGFSTRLIDNSNNTRISLDDLNTAAFDFYIKQVTNLSLSQQKANKVNQEIQKPTKDPIEYVNQIREMLSKNKIPSVKIAQ